jgi:ATP-dependent DNA helicase RecG
VAVDHRCGMTTSLDSPLARVIGGRTATALADAFDMHTVGALLRHYPRRYARRGELTSLATLGEELATVFAEVAAVREIPNRTRGGSRLEVVVTDGIGRLSITFFNKVPYHRRRLRPGAQGLFAGKVGSFRGQLQLTHPEYVLVAAPGEEVDPEAAGVFARNLIPVYPATASLPSWRIAKCVDIVLEGLVVDQDPLPAAVRAELGLIELGDAFRLIHRPETDSDYGIARDRLKFEEAFVLQCVLAQRRVQTAQLPAIVRLGASDGLLSRFDAALPFELTAGQRNVSAAVFEDLRRPHPMHRLLQGEVGSGKTVVALRAMLAVVDAGGQAALLAPTEVLAQQHVRTIRALLGPLAEGGLLGGASDGTRVALLTGSATAAVRRAALLDVVSGAAGIVVGTHALLEDRVQFNDLGLVVVDEQHRFGVEQRAALAAKSADGSRPHVLVMTATPIPRTVAMTVFGDLEVSTLEELPSGRAPISTHVIAPLEAPTHLDRAWQRIREEVELGHRAYVVCPRIGGTGAEDEIVEPQAEVDEAATRRSPLAVLDVFESLTAGPLAGLRVGALHGRLPADEKEDLLRRFAADPGTTDVIDVLVCTTVVEVGVDVGRAVVMVVLDADRFGVSQLHQLRGRVGRAGLPGLCLLVTEAPPASPARERLSAVAATVDGFELARLDLSARREGDVLGVAQSGRRSSLRLLSVLRDEDVIIAARAAASDLITADPALAGEPALAAAIAELVGEQAAEFLERS